MQYALEDYDSHGYLKAPIWLLLGWGWLARAWVVFIVASASRQDGASILSIVYPSTEGFYLGLAAGLPALAMLWCVHLRRDDRPYLNRIMRYCRPVTIILTLIQIVSLIEHIALRFWQFHWLDALSLLILSWFMLYLFQSKRIRSCFESMNIEN